MKTLVRYLRENSPMFRAGRVPRAELWISTQVLKSAELTDDVQGHLELRKRFGMDILFLPFSEGNPRASTVDYRFFTLDDIREGEYFNDLPVGVIISGPFQRFVERMGLTSALMELTRSEGVVPQEFQEEASQARFLIREASRLCAKVLVIADDIAWERSLYMAPEQLAGLLEPFYCDAVADIHAHDAYALFHSCGNATAFVPRLVSCGFDGLAAWQSNAVDLVGLSSTHRHLTLLAGLEASILDMNELTTAVTAQPLVTALSLAKKENLVLGSSCGLRDERSLANLRLFYSLVDHQNDLS